MATLVGRDRVSAVYPGFHKVPGFYSDATALAVNGPERIVPGCCGVQDAIVIRKVRTLTLAAARGFDMSLALAITPKNPTMKRYSHFVKTVYEGSATVCGHRAFAFITINSIVIPEMLDPAHPQKLTTESYDMLNTHVVSVFERDVWDADYARVYSPGIEKTQLRSLVRFTSNYCVQSSI